MLAPICVFEAAQEGTAPGSRLNEDRRWLWKNHTREEIHTLAGSAWAGVEALEPVACFIAQIVCAEEAESSK